MTHNTIIILFYVSLGLGLPSGLFLFTWWAIKVLRKVQKNKIKNLGLIKIMLLFYLFPGVVMFALSSIPFFYFSHLLKQETYCKKIVEANKMIQKNDPLIQERCSFLNLDELFKNRSTSFGWVLP